MTGNGRYLIRNGRIVNSSATVADEIAFEADIRIADGKIQDIQPTLSGDSKETEIDASGLWILPGFIDLHTHLRDLGQADRETIASGTRAAAAGGYTTVVAMANTDPPTDSALVLGHINALIARDACIEVLPVACVTKGLGGEELTNMAELAEMGAIAFSDDGMPLSDLGVLRRALEYTDVLGRFIISHPEDKCLSGGGAMNEGGASVRLGLPGIPVASESACVAREIEVLRYTGGRLHFAHISTAPAVELIRKAKADRLSVTADVTPHHLVLCDEDITEFDTCYKMNPPLRTTRDQRALVEALLDGTIDAVATDHAPHPWGEKTKAFAHAPFGVIGLETAFPLVLERLATDDPLVHLEVISMFTTNPAKILGMPAPRIASGCPANLSLFEPHLRWTYDTTLGLSKSRNSPFNGRRMKGKTLITMCKGAVVYHDETHAHGRFTKQPVSV